MKPIALALFIGVIAANPVLVKHRPMENPDLLGGDIVRINSHLGRNAVSEDSQLWPGGIIPYVMNDDVGNHVEDVLSAMDHISEHTCIQFQPRTDEEDYLEITYGTGWSGCNSHWGQIGGQQKLTLGSGCYIFGTIVHELMHAIGFEHEHNRSDRDDYISILWDNIDEMYHPAFMKLLPMQNRLLTPFDYDSIMMYGSMAFAKEDGLHSMEANDGRGWLDVAEKPGLSESDIKRVNILYQCENS